MLSGRRRISVRTRNCVFCFDLMAALNLAQALHRSNFCRDDNRFCTSAWVTIVLSLLRSLSARSAPQVSRKCGHHSLLVILCPFVKSSIKVNLHSIRLSSVFLRFCFSLKKYSLFRPHFCKSISALNRLLRID